MLAVLIQRRGFGPIEKSSPLIVKVIMAVVCSSSVSISNRLLQRFINQQTKTGYFNITQADTIPITHLLGSIFYTTSVPPMINPKQELHVVPAK